MVDWAKEATRGATHQYPEFEEAPASGTAHRIRSTSRSLGDVLASGSAASSPVSRPRTLFAP